MPNIKRLPDEDFIHLVTIADRAYPAFATDSPESKEKLAEQLKHVQLENPYVHYYGYYDDNRLKGIMRFHDFTMTYHTQQIKACGIGMVGVDLLHKKEKIARDMLKFFLQHYHEKGVNMALLYPFRPDFYKKMGFGAGTNKVQYRLKPSAFPNRGSKDHLCYLISEDLQQIVDCYNRFAVKNHGAMEKRAYEFERLLGSNENHVIGYKKDGILEGYLIFSFKRGNEDNFLLNDLLIKEFVYLNRQVISEFCTFLHSQDDQINRIILDTQDEYLHYLFSDARNDSNHIIPSVYHETGTVGTGIMYRVLDIEGIFKDLEKHNFNGVNGSLTFRITDTFFPQNNGDVTVSFQEGVATVVNDGNGEVEVEMDISDFSSLIMGSVTFERLYTYGLAKISDEKYVEMVHRMFLSDQKPVCMSLF